MSSLHVDQAHPAAEAVAAMNAALDEFAAAPLWSMPTRALADLVVQLEKVANRLDAAQVTILAQAETSLVRTLLAAKTTHGWLKTAADVPSWMGRARLQLAHQLDTRPATAAAFSAGEITMGAATAVCNAIEALPASVPAAMTGEVEDLLLKAASHYGSRAVTRTAMNITYRFAPDVLEEQEVAARQNRFVSLTTRADGTVALRGLLDKEAGALAIAVLGPLAAPTPAVDGIPDLRETGARYADAFVQLCQLATPDLPQVRGERPNVAVTVSLESLQAKVVGCAPAMLDSGIPLSIGATLRLLCDANVIPIVLGSHGEPLDIGRLTRNIPNGMRRALVARDQGCAFPGCDRPASWCDAHHCKYWSDGGETALCNLCLLCSHHHDVVHHDGWEITMINAMPWFIPPAWIDSDRRPRQHDRHKIRVLRT
ncbi:MAG TPA: DUF222 domain-containing protein [Acidothermaceae bacterium]|nr:DUF222 domain-containing protein [Acidothermaceae bacterium]